MYDALVITRKYSRNFKNQFRKDLILFKKFIGLRNLKQKNF